MRVLPASLINLSEYPLQDLDAEVGRKLITSMRADLHRDGSCCLHNFLTHNAVRAILQGDRTGVRRVAIEAGTLMLFRGHYSLHRVTEVTGQRDRLQSILGFNARPGAKGSMESNILHYGPRVAEMAS